MVAVGVLLFAFIEVEKTIALTGAGNAQPLALREGDARMKILVFNAGSSSLKFAVFNLSGDELPLCKGEFKNFAAKGSMLKLQVNGVEESRSELACNLQEAIARVPALLAEAGLSQFDAISHRVAHGGARQQGAALIDEKILDEIRALIPLAPLHNPVNLQAIELSRSLWPDVAQVAVFDTAFHHTIPEHAYTYAVPKQWREHGVRRYGFHGISHQYVGLRVAQALGQPVSELKTISCHLGSGASICAIDGGQSIDTSMGMTPLEGLIMSTRSGNVDPGLFAYLAREFNLDAQTVERELYRASGLMAIAEQSDLQQVEQRAAEGDRQAQLAVAMYAYRVRKYIGAYAAAMGGVHALVFTGGVGENSASMRQRICERFAYMGLALDAAKNQALTLSGSDAPQIHAELSQIKVLVTQTREQYMIAQAVKQLLN